MNHGYQEKTIQSLFQNNKENAFVALYASGINNIVIKFDGYADNGQIDEWEIELKGGDYIYDSDLLPQVSVKRTVLHCAQAQPHQSQIVLARAVEELCYDLLDESYSGWGNNDGSYGTFVFDVEDGTITLEHSRRSVETTTVEA